MFVPLLVLDGLLAAVLLVLLIRRARLRTEAEALPERLEAAEARAERAIAALRRATDASPPADASAVETRTDPPAERRPRRRVRRVGPPATPDRP